MSLPLLFARRYLLARRGVRGRSRNAINILTGISITVVAVITAAMVIVLSTLNGISELVDKLYSPFDQDLTITPAQGKTFDRDQVDLAALQALPGVVSTSWTIEENVLLESGDRRTVATIKGVEPQYLAMSGMSEHMYLGRPELEGVTGPVVLLGASLKDQLGVPQDDGVMRPLGIAAPVRGRKISKHRQGAFERTRVAMAGAFTINLEFDGKYVIAPLDLTSELLHYGRSVNALEIRTGPGSDVDALAAQVRQRLGTDYEVRTRQQKNALMYRTNATEKWFTFLMLVFIGLIAAFNIIASLTLMMIEKQQDMRTLSGMGATPSFVRRVFFLEGLLIVGVGIAAGLAVGVGVCVLQQQLGLVALQDSVVDSYPVRVLTSDLLLIVGTVLIIGAVAAWVPLRSLSRRYLQAATA